MEAMRDNRRIVLIVLVALLLICLVGVLVFNMFFADNTVTGGGEPTATLLPTEEVALTTPEISQLIVEVNESGPTSPINTLGEVEITYPEYLSPGSSEVVELEIYIPEYLVTQDIAPFERISLSSDTSPIIGEVTPYTATILIDEKMRIELSSLAFAVKSHYPSIQLVDVNSINKSTYWTWEIVAPREIGVYVFTIMAFLNDNNVPTWVKSFQVKVVEFTPTPTPTPTFTLTPTSTSPPEPTATSPPPSTPTPIPFMDRPVGVAITWVSGITVIVALIFVGVLLVTGQSLSNFVTFSEEAGIKNEIQILQRRLHKLRETQALLGSSADPHLVIEIEDIEARIEKLQVRLKIIQDTRKID